MLIRVVFFFANTNILGSHNIFILLRTSVCALLFCKCNPLITFEKRSTEVLPVQCFAGFPHGFSPLFCSMCCCRRMCFSPTPSLWLFFSFGNYICIWLFLLRCHAVTFCTPAPAHQPFNVNKFLKTLELCGK